MVEAVANLLLVVHMEDVITQKLHEITFKTSQIVEDQYFSVIPISQG